MLKITKCDIFSSKSKTFNISVRKRLILNFINKQLFNKKNPLIFLFLQYRLEGNLENIITARFQEVRRFEKC